MAKLHAEYDKLEISLAQRIEGAKLSDKLTAILTLSHALRMQSKNFGGYLPDGRFMKTFVGLALTENVEVAAGTELGQQTRPPGTIQRGIQRGQEGVIQHFQYFPFYPCPALFVPTHKLSLIHHFGGKEAPIITVLALQLNEVHAADVAAAQAVNETQVA